MPHRARAHDAERASRGHAASVPEFLRLFVAAGVYHCGGGPGAGSADLLSAVDAWVVDGAPPDDVVATRVVSAANPVSITRPLCAHPSYPRHSGSGDTNIAAGYFLRDAVTDSKGARI